jgi:hypothetical protein
MHPERRLEAGSSTISYTILLLLFLALLFGSFQIFKLVHMKQELSRATYLSVRQLANEASFPWETQVRERAHDTIYDKLRHGGGFIAREFDQHEADLRRHLFVNVDMDPLKGHSIERQGVTSLVFEIEATIQFPWLFKLPLLHRRSIRISARHVGSFTHPRYTYTGRKPAQDPEGQWHVSPLPTWTPVP